MQWPKSPVFAYIGPTFMSAPEKTATELHDRILAPLAKRLAFDIARWPKHSASTPVVLFLGNHSSGKSSFVNFLMNRSVQATGLAPTDDGFTVLTWGVQEATADGPTATSHPGLDLGDFAHLGPAFTAKLRFKTVPCELLRSVTLVDSPGMIDAMGAVNTRGYEFPAAVKTFAERADLILFFFDPDKPGTTAESVSVLTDTLSGMGHKLLLILNKVDQFHSFPDLARTYGTLCWNLAKAIRTKDIPHIALCYLPADDGAPRRAAGVLPLAEFDAARQQILEEIRRTPARRADNLVTELLRRAQEIHLHARVCRELGRHFLRLRLQWLAALAGATLLAGIATWLVWQQPPAWSNRLLVVLVGAATIAGAWFLGRWQARRFTRRSFNPAVLDEAFSSAFESELSLRDRADLRALWEAIRPRTARAVQWLGPGRLSVAFGLALQISRLHKAITQDIPALRRDLGGPQPELPLRDDPKKSA
ncbi:MAG: dynamin family protein, partial [Verrucomicrobiales bacterium]|nr:dynamin family protein [Verrucomicrobiales bacterium]